MTVTDDSERLRRIEDLLSKMNVDPDTLPMVIDKQETISPSRWIENGKTYSTQVSRKQCLAYWVTSNGKTVGLEKKRATSRATWNFDSLLRAVAEVLSEIIHRKLSLYASPASTR
jgi:hypothetical protein